MKEDTSVWPSRLEPLCVGRVGQHRRGQVRASHGLAGAPGRHRRWIDLEAELVQAGGHGLGPPFAIAPGLQQPGGQHRVVVVDAVAEDVQVLEFPVHGGDLRGGHDLDAVLGPGGQGLVDPVHRVVVGQREKLHSGLCRRRHHTLRRQLTVGVDGVGLKVECRNAHGANISGRQAKE